MQTAPLGPSDLASTRLIYGCMRTVGTWNPNDFDEQKKNEAKAALDAAYESGYRHFDHADIYCRGMCEAVFGEWLSERKISRDDLLLTTKCGIRFGNDPDADAPHRYDFSKEHILHSCEQSLKRLGIDTLDVYLLHRPDVLMNPPEVAAAFDQLKQQGKVRRFGVSNFTIPQFEDLQSALDEPLVCNQIQIHPLRLEPIEDGTLNTLRRLNVTPTAWSPVAQGRCGDDFKAENGHLASLHAALDKEGAALGLSRAATTLVWLMTHPSRIQPIIGSRTPERIRDAATADGKAMSREAWYRIYLAARGEKLP